MKKCLECFATAAAPTAKEMMEKLEDKVSRRQSMLKEYQFLTIEKVSLRGLKTTPIRQLFNLCWYVRMHQRTAVFKGSSFKSFAKVTFLLPCSTVPGPCSLVLEIVMRWQIYRRK